MEQTSTGTTSIDMDTVVRALATRSRRRLLATLLETTNQTVRLEPFVEGLAASDRAPAPDIVALQLRHCDLPHLEAAGLVEFDARSETIIATDRVERVEPLLDAARRVERALRSDV